MGVQMSACYQCGEHYPSAPAGHIHKCGRCSGYCSPIPTTPTTTKAPVYLVETTPATKPDNCPTCGDPANVFCSDGFHAPGKTYWPAEAPDLVERVARAVCSAHGNDPDDFLKALGFCRWVMYQPHARAAIAAMPGGGPGAWVPADHLAEANREIARLREALEWLQDNQLCGLVKREEVVSAALKGQADEQ